MAAAASISGSRTSYPSVPMAHSGRRRTSGCTVIRSSFAPCSPACKPTTLRIGSKWAELQGARDWDGLLSPLDGTLRGELVRYGEFVRAAYASFDFDGGAPSYGSCRFPSRSLLSRAGMPGTGYRVTRLLHAASTSAPRWLPSLSPPCGSSYIGFVAVCDDEREIERLGRRDVVVAFRGTATCGEWVDNFKSGLTRLPIPTGEENGEEEAMVESGFWRLFTAPGEAHSSLQQQVRDEARRIAHEYGGSGMPLLSITVTGHSLGAALAVLTAHEIAATQQPRQEEEHSGAEEPAMMVTAVSFGGPRVGNAAFRRRLEESGGKVLRVVNSDDIVTKVPGFPVHENDDGNQPAKGMMKARVPRWFVSKMGWAYADVGRELRLRQAAGSASNVVASHDLDLYLKLIASCTD
ncbi:phospholipase A(1) DAD1, chloroplastic-like [Miscanthus floridulus]|uniref:phospholipase A(1) DAD1, chloroplastic-like n=1 Tax=Miscanthus floridulus TaxID=154761 RepID=UPI00345ACA73